MDEQAGIKQLDIDDRNETLESKIQKIFLIIKLLNTK